MIEPVLYATPEADRFFLVPTSVKLPAGGFVVVAQDGTERRVALSVVTRYEVPRERAKAHLYAEMEQAFADVEDTLTRALGATAKHPPDLERFGFVAEDRESVEASLRHLADDVQAITAAIESGAPDDVDAARERLKARGIDLGDSLKQLHTLNEECVGAWMRRLVDELGAEERPLGRRIDDLIDRLELEAGPWLGRDIEADRERRREEYRTSARSSIADALRDAGITPLNDPAEDHPKG